MTSSFWLSFIWACTDACPNSEEIFKTLGFHVEQIAGRGALSPPSTDRSTPEGASNRHKLLRAYIEVGAWLQQYRERHSAFVQCLVFADVDCISLIESELGAESIKHVNTVVAVNAETEFKLAIGADPVSSESFMCILLRILLILTVTSSTTWTPRLRHTGWSSV
jgi:hypothetical protein